MHANRQMPQTKRVVIGLGPPKRAARRRRRTGVISLLVALLAAGASSAQMRKPGPLAPGTASIRGKVVDADTKEPLPNVGVSVFQQPRSIEQGFRAAETKTNAEGAYEFAGIADGEYYSVSVDSRSHLQPRNSSRVYAEKDRASEMNFELTRGATARGRVVDGAGKPVARARVQLTGRYPRAPIAFLRPGVTAADGSFALTLVPAGEWQIEVDLPQARGAMRPPLIYHPGVFWREEATTITLRAGETIDNIEVVVPRVTENALTVQVAASPPVLANVSASLLSAAPLAVYGIALNEAGVGTIKGLIDGRYFVAARAWSRDQSFVAFEAVNFVGQQQQVSLHLRHAGRIRGKIVTLRGALPSLDGVQIGAAWVHDDVQVNPLVPDHVKAGPDGRFLIDGLFGTRKMELFGLSQDWRIQSVLQGRVDVTNGVNVPLDSTVDLTIVLARR